MPVSILWVFSLKLVDLVYSLLDQSLDQKAMSKISMQTLHHDVVSIWLRPHLSKLVLHANFFL